MSSTANDDVDFFAEVVKCLSSRPSNQCTLLMAKVSGFSVRAMCDYISISDCSYQKELYQTYAFDAATC